MKNFGSILAFIALSAGVVSARAVPNENGVQARAPYPNVVVELDSREAHHKGRKANARDVLPREPKRGKKKGKKAGAAAGAAAGAGAGAGAGAAANATAPDAALATGVAGKKGKKGKGKDAAGAVLVEDPAAAANSTAAVGKAAKKGKGKDAAADVLVLDPAGAAANATVAEPAVGKAAKKGKGADSAASEQKAASKEETQLSDIIEGLTGIDIGSIGLRSEVEARSPQNKEENVQK